MRQPDCGESGDFAFETPSLLARVSVPSRGVDPIAQIALALGEHDLGALYLFVSPNVDFKLLCRHAARRFPDHPVIACTTSGEIGDNGYMDDHIVAVGLPRNNFAVASVVIEGLDTLDEDHLRDTLIRRRLSLRNAHPKLPNGFAFLLVDGLSLGEDRLLTTIFPALGGMPIFGGSAADGSRFERTEVALDGHVVSNAAVLTFVATNCEPHVFSIDHMVPTDQRMVVTDADPSRRIVKRINAEPAALEYARIIGTTPDLLDEHAFAAHPLVVRMGDTHHVRSIQRVTDAGELVFFSAIDEGMVLTFATPDSIAPHLDEALARLSRHRPPADILACDCMLRRLEAEQTQSLRAVSDVLRRHRVTGFSTYGEQIGPIHVNHTMTGVALYPPAEK